MFKRFSTIFVSLVCIGIFWPSISFAHQPNLVKDFTQPVLIKNPEVSKAYYGKLSGQSDEFIIEASDSFNLYVGISLPDVSGARKDMIVTVYRNDQFLFKLQGDNETWTKFYESFGQDDYLVVPEQEMRVEDGTYTISVDSKDGTGQYVLVVGKKEEFPITAAVNALKVLPTIKQDFFGKSAWGMITIPYIWIPLAILFVVFLFFVWLMRRS